MSTDAHQFRWSLPGRLRHFRRTLRQLRCLAACGPAAARVAEQVILSGLCIQRKWELLAMMARVKRLRPEVVVEIGTYRGGSLRCWALVCPETTRFVSIDLPWEAGGQGDPADDLAAVGRFLKPRQSLHWLRRDSHAAATKEELLNILGSRPIDFLFIDGDHSYDGVKNDYALYHRMVRRGGIIAFHDIVASARHPEHRVHDFWSELKQRNRVEELVDRGTCEEAWGGIGVIRVQV